MKNTINFGVIKDGTFRKIIDDDGNIIVIVTFPNFEAIKFEGGEIEFVEDSDYFMSYFMDYDYDFIEADEAKSLLSELNYLETEPNGMANTS